MKIILKKYLFYQPSWFKFVRLFAYNYWKNKSHVRSASLTYTTMLSLIPILTVLLVVLSSIPALDSVRGQIYQHLINNLMPSSSLQITEYIHSFTEKSSHLTTYGIIALFVTTTFMLKKIESDFNEIWQVKNSFNIKSMAGWLEIPISLMRYLFLMIALPLFLGTAFIVSAAINSAKLLNQQYYVFGRNWQLSWVVDWIVDWSWWGQVLSFIVTMIGFVVMYWFIPRTFVPIKNAIIAGLIVSILFELLKRIFGMVMINFTSYEAIYGAFTALPVFLLWINLSWHLILVGVELCHSLTIFKVKAKT